MDVPLNGSYTNDSLKNGIGRNIVLDGIVYIHAIDTSNNLTLIAFNMFTESFSIVTGQVETLITAWTAKHAPYSFYRIAYDSYTTRAIGAIECREDGTNIEVEILYIDDSVLKLYSKHTFVAEPSSKPSEIVLDTSKEAYAGSSKVTYYDTCRTFTNTPDRYSASLLFQNGNAFIVLSRIGYPTYRPLLGISRIDLNADLRPQQLYLNSISFPRMFSYNINEAGNATYNLVRCGSNNMITFVYMLMSNLAAYPNQISVSYYTSSVYTYAGVVVQDESKFRIADAYGVPLYYGE